VSGSPRGYILLSGDVVGPIFPDDKPISYSSCFPTGLARYSKGTDLHLFNLAMNIWQLHYLRLVFLLLLIKECLSKNFPPRIRPKGHYVGPLGRRPIRANVPTFGEGREKKKDGDDLPHSGKGPKVFAFIHFSG